MIAMPSSFLPNVSTLSRLSLAFATKRKRICCPCTNFVEAACMSQLFYSSSYRAVMKSSWGWNWSSWVAILSFFCSSACLCCCYWSFWRSSWRSLAANCLSRSSPITRYLVSSSSCNWFWMFALRSRRSLSLSILYCLWGAISFE